MQALPFTGRAQVRQRTFIDKKAMEYFLTYEKWMDEVINQVEGWMPTCLHAC